MSETLEPPPALLRMIGRYLVARDECDGEPALAIHRAIDDLTVEEKQELLRFCEVLRAQPATATALEEPA
ncbi:hypothetical protein GCM10011390_11640 [Aureimonas endophytica]|uniref:Uncharacterized protein n=1 Tax=Aureimonas endophytica TaxID=2027858 RepID=A0A917E2I5_9HYPH|nr:hypothetical protein [Aureimonas endophytica]GGD94562.1 hypothetical protein GCM10011390_11640 [Aureimonas endophytica]